MGARNQAKIFSMGSAILLMLATEVLVGYHYWRMLSGVSLVAIVGLGVVAYVLGWSTWWASNAGEDKPVKYTAYFVAAVISITMIINGAAVVVLLRKDFKLEQMQAHESDMLKARGAEVRKLKEAGGSWRDIREFSRSESARDQRPMESSETITDANTSEWMKRIEVYGQFWIFLVPLLVAIGGKFILLGAIALPGGADSYAPKVIGSRATSTTISMAPQPAAKAGNDPKA